MSLVDRLKERVKSEVTGSLAKGQLLLHSIGGKTLEVSWDLWSALLHSTVAIGGQHDLVIAIALPPGSVRFVVDRLLPMAFKPKDGRNVGVALSGGTLYLDIWSNRARISPDDPWWQRMAFSPLDLVLGKAVKSEQFLGESVERVKLPEGRYQAVVRLAETTWTRTRWPFPVTMIRAHVRIVGNGIPLPGSKGGEECLPELTCVASTSKEACKKMADFVKSTRVRKGGPNWSPKTAPPELPKRLKKRIKLKIGRPEKQEDDSKTS